MLKYQKIQLEEIANMLTNYHTHTTYCDGNNTLEEIVLSAIDSGMNAIGFSGHGYTPYDDSYCMQNTEEYLNEITSLKEKYKSKIQIYAGIEEDSFHQISRKDFDYIIGSSHYFLKDGVYYPVDSDYDCFKECLKLFDYNVESLAENYYSAFCDYISRRKPDIVGHFDLITKFDEIDIPRFFNNENYLAVAKKYMSEAVKNDVIFEVNTGAISRGFRKDPYPHADLLHIIKRNNGKVILSSDSHSKDTLTSYFEDAKAILRHIGFKHISILYDNEFKQINI